MPDDTHTPATLILTADSPWIGQAYLVPGEREVSITLDVFELTGANNEGVMIDVDEGNDLSQWFPAAGWGPVEEGSHPFETPSLGGRYLRVRLAILTIEGEEEEPATATVELCINAQSLLDAQQPKREEPRFVASEFTWEPYPDKLFGTRKRSGLGGVL
ncbi:MAG: hypothetical protein ACE5F1_11295 [Planctomycetota bacterium]